MWGFTFISIAVLLRDFSPLEILLFRFGLGTLVLYIAYPKRMGKTTLRQELLFAGAGLTGVALYGLAQAVALVYTSASNVSVIVASTPVFMGLFSWWLLGKRRPTATFFAGFFVAISGIALISFSGIRLELNLGGDLLALIAAICWGLFAVFGQKISALGHHFIHETRRSFLYGFLFLIPAAFFGDFHFGLERFSDPSNLFNMLFLALGSSALCFALWNFALNRLGPVTAGAYIYLKPIVTVVAAVLVLSETVTWTNVSGIALILCGVLLSGRKPRREAEVSAE